ncbi:coproporphyrinogen III oxidase-like Fe-S oxidoreductase [Bradyrhizobium liaoningense]
MATLHAEIRLVAEQAPRALPVSDVHFGGGTPTTIAPADFLALMALLRRCFAFSKSATIAIEIDPRAFTAEMVETLQVAGVNRASIGVQSFDGVVQRSVNRVQSEVQTASVVESLRQHGISRINFDLLFGLPHQTVRSCVDSTRTALAMRPDRLAVVRLCSRPLLYETSAPDR